MTPAGFAVAGPAFAEMCQGEFRAHEMETPMPPTPPHWGTSFVRGGTVRRAAARLGGPVPGPDYGTDDPYTAHAAAALTPALLSAALALPPAHRGFALLYRRLGPARGRSQVTARCCP